MIKLFKDEDEDEEGDDFLHSLDQKRSGAEHKVEELSTRRGDLKIPGGPPRPLGQGDVGEREN